MHHHAQPVCIRASRWCISIISGPKALQQLYQRRDLLSSKVNAPPDTFSLIWGTGTGFCLFLHWALLFVCCLCLLWLGVTTLHVQSVTGWFAFGWYYFRASRWEQPQQQVDLFISAVLNIWTEAVSPRLFFWLQLSPHSGWRSLLTCCRTTKLLYEKRENARHEVWT